MNTGWVLIAKLSPYPLSVWFDIPKIGTASAISFFDISLIGDYGLPVSTLVAIVSDTILGTFSVRHDPAVMHVYVASF